MGTFKEGSQPPLCPYLTPKSPNYKITHHISVFPEGGSSSGKLRQRPRKFWEDSTGMPREPKTPQKRHKGPFYGEKATFLKSLGRSRHPGPRHRQSQTLSWGRPRGRAGERSSHAGGAAQRFWSFKCLPTPSGPGTQIPGRRDFQVPSGFRCSLGGA